MLRNFRRSFGHLWFKLRLLLWRKSRSSKVVIRKFGRRNSRTKLSFSGLQSKPMEGNSPRDPIRVATFNVALFSLAPALPKAEMSSLVGTHGNEDYSNLTARPKSILKQSPLHPSISGMSDNLISKPKMRVSINLPENEISLAQNKVLRIVDAEPWSNGDGMSQKQALMRSPVCFPSSMINWMEDGSSLRGSRSIFDVLKEVDADILALQDVKAEEEKGMKPLSDLAYALGMNYVFAESWAPEYGNAILSKWPIKKWKVQKIFDDQDFRNVLKATIDVPWAGEINFYCTQLDHLDENWRMKQVNAIIQSSDRPHILAGGLNALSASDYSFERWTDIVKYYEEIGKPTPKTDVMSFLNGKEYTDPKQFAGECEPVVIITKGQNVQGTCKYGTRVDYILASNRFPYKFVPGSYSVVSSKGTSDHHIVKVDIMKVSDDSKSITRQKKIFKQSFSRMRNSCSSRGIGRISP